MLLDLHTVRPSQNGTEYPVVFTCVTLNSSNMLEIEGEVSIVSDAASHYGPEHGKSRKPWALVRGEWFACMLF